MARVIMSAHINPNAINKGVISAAKEDTVRKHFKFPEGCSTIEFEASDELGNMHKLKAERRTRGYYPKETIAGLRTYIQAKGLVVGDRITIFKEGNEVKLFGAVLRPPVYSIEFDKSARGGGNITGAEAGEN